MPRYIKVPCPSCSRILRARAEYIGLPGTCKHCGQVFLLKKYVQIACPNCSRSLDIRQEYLGRSIACKGCGHAFRADAETRGVAARDDAGKTLTRRDGRTEP